MKIKRTSENGRCEDFEYSELKITDYWSPSNKNISIEKQKWLFKYRVEDIDKKSNRMW